MTYIFAQRLIASAVALVVGVSLVGVASAQDTSNAGLIVGQVARCVNGAEEPAANVAVGIDGGGSSLSRSDSGGEFFLSLPPGQYTVTATGPDGSASRQYVPVEAGQSLDIGILDLGAGIAGCGPDSSITAPVLPTFTPTPAAVQPTPTIVEPTVAPTVQATPELTPSPMPASEPTPAG
jgi:hypothetical protein